MKNQRQSLKQIFLIPLATFTLSTAGLIIALIVDGKADLLAGLAAATPIIVLSALAFHSIRPD